MKQTQESFKLHVSGAAGCRDEVEQVSAHIDKAIQNQAIFRIQAAAPAQECHVAVQNCWKSSLYALLFKSLIYFIKGSKIKNSVQTAEI